MEVMTMLGYFNSLIIVNENLGNTKLSVCLMVSFILIYIHLILHSFSTQTCVDFILSNHPVQ